MPAILKKFTLKEANLNAAILKPYMGARLFMWRQSAQLKIDGKEKNLPLTLHPSQGQQRVFFPSGHPPHYLQQTYLANMITFLPCDDSFGRLQLCNLSHGTECKRVCANRTVVISQVNHHMIRIAWQQSCKHVNQIRLCYHSIVGACLAQNNMAQEQP